MLMPKLHFLQRKRKKNERKKEKTKNKRKKRKYISLQHIVLHRFHFEVTSLKYLFIGKIYHTFFSFPFPLLLLKHFLFCENVKRLCT